MKERVYFHTFGCKVNQYETQILRQKIIDLNNEIIDSYENANLCFVNSCTVTQNADADCRQLIRGILRSNPSARIIVTGCYAVRAPEEIQQLSPRIEIYTEKEEIPLTTFNEHTRAFIKIQDGCDAFCSYCIIPYVRSKLKNRNPQEIITEIKNLISQGYKEIVLTGIRLGKYRFDNVESGITNLVDLLQELEKIKGLCRIRLSSLEINEIDKKLLDLMVSSKKICPHLHVPLQSGDNEILRRMRRPYTIEEYTEKIRWIQDRIPEIGITTDIMVGFPGEREENFFRTYECVKELEFSRLHVFPYSLRPNTVAAEFKEQIPANIKKLRREKFIQLDRLLRERFKEKFIGKKMEVLLDKEEKNGTYSGFTGNYIRLKVNQGKKNEILRLKIN